MIYYPDNFGKIGSINIDKTLSYMKIKVLYIITYDDANLISNFIIDENKIKDHMVEKTAVSILDSADKYGCIKITHNDNIIGFIGLYNYSEVYELGSLCIWKEFNNLGLGTILQKLLLDKYCDLPIFLVTNVDKVKHISQKVGLLEVTIGNISNSILSIIEEGGKLLSDDSIYLNKKLYGNNKFNLLIDNKND